MILRTHADDRPGITVRIEEASLGAQLRAAERDDEIFVETVWVPASARSRGVGTRLLDRVLMLADALGKPVRLEARPIGTGNADAHAAMLRLVSWYRRFGFEVVDGAASVPTMVRPTRPAPTPAPRAGGP